MASTRVKTLKDIYQRASKRRAPKPSPVLEGTARMRGPDVPANNVEKDPFKCSICEETKLVQGILCDNCSRSFHITCLPIVLKEIPSRKWLCPQCNEKSFSEVQIQRLTPAEKGSNSSKKRVHFANDDSTRNTTRERKSQTPKKRSWEDGSEVTEPQSKISKINDQQIFATPTKLELKSIKTGVLDMGGSESKETSSLFKRQKKQENSPSSVEKSKDSIDLEFLVCVVCGDKGDTDCLVFCCDCVYRCQHTYCMKVLLKEPPLEWWCSVCLGNSGRRIWKVKQPVFVGHVLRKDQQGGMIKERRQTGEGSFQEKEIGEEEVFLKGKVDAKLASSETGGDEIDDDQQTSFGRRRTKRKVGVVETPATQDKDQKGVAGLQQLTEDSALGKLLFVSPTEKEGNEVQGLFQANLSEHSEKQLNEFRNHFDKEGKMQELKAGDGDGHKSEPAEGPETNSVKESKIQDSLKMNAVGTTEVRVTAGPNVEVNGEPVILSNVNFSGPTTRILTSVSPPVKIRTEKEDSAVYPVVSNDEPILPDSSGSQKMEKVEPNGVLEKDMLFVESASDVNTQQGLMSQGKPSEKETAPILEGHAEPNCEYVVAQKEENIPVSGKDSTGAHMIEPNEKTSLYVSIFGTSPDSRPAVTNGRKPFQEHIRTDPEKERNEHNIVAEAGRGGDLFPNPKSCAIQESPVKQDHSKLQSEVSDRPILSSKIGPEKYKTGSNNGMVSELLQAALNNKPRVSANSAQGLSQSSNLRPIPGLTAFPNRQGEGDKVVLENTKMARPSVFSDSGTLSPHLGSGRGTMLPGYLSANKLPIDGSRPVDWNCQPSTRPIAFSPKKPSINLMTPGAVFPLSGLSKPATSPSFNRERQGEGSSAPQENKKLTQSGNMRPSPSLSTVAKHGEGEKGRIQGERGRIHSSATGLDFSGTPKPLEGSRQPSNSPAKQFPLSSGTPGAPESFLALPKPFSGPSMNREGEVEGSTLPSFRVSSTRPITPPGFSSKSTPSKQSFSGIPVQKSETMRQLGLMPLVGDNKSQRIDTGKGGENRRVEKKVAGNTKQKDTLMGGRECAVLSSERIVDASQTQSFQNSETSPLRFPPGFGTKVASSGRETQVGNFGKGHIQSSKDKSLSRETAGPKTGKPSVVTVGGNKALETLDPLTSTAPPEEKVEKRVGLKGFLNGRRLKSPVPIPNALKKEIIVLEKKGSEEEDVDVDIESPTREGLSFGRDKHEKESGARWNCGQDVLDKPVFIKKEEMVKAVDKINQTVIVQKKQETENGPGSSAFQMSEVGLVEVQNKEKEEKLWSFSRDNRTSLMSLGGAAIVEGDKRGGQDEIVDIDSD